MLLAKYDAAVVTEAQVPLYLLNASQQLPSSMTIRHIHTCQVAVKVLLQTAVCVIYM
jgi:hypothetical protein